MNMSFSVGSLSHVFTTSPTPLGIDAISIVSQLVGYLDSFNFDVDPPKIFATTHKYSESAMSFMTPPQPTSLAQFRGHGKLIVFHGAADPVFSVADTIDWFAATTAAGSDFARLYLVPGMGHCSGGMATDRFDLLAPLVDWVEHGVAPAAVSAALTAGNSDVPASWAVPKPKIAERMAQSLIGRSSSPITNSSSTTPNSPTCRMLSTLFN